MQYRLDSVSRQLAHDLRRASKESHRRVAIEACRFALDHASVDDPDVLLAAKTLASAAPVPDDVLARVRSFVHVTDERYLNAREAEESGQRGAGGWLESFGRARAGAAIAAACDPNSLSAAAESVYEASVTVDDANDLFRICLSIVQSDER